MNIWLSKRSTGAHPCVLGVGQTIEPRSILIIFKYFESILSIFQKVVDFLFRMNYCYYKETYKMFTRMVQFNDVTKSYKTIETAKKQADKFAAQFEILFADDVKRKTVCLMFTIVARDDGRFVPVVTMSSMKEVAGGFTFALHNKHGVCVIG